jgi:beta-galactosidase
LENVEWFGRGPQENYIDRKTAAFVGQYKSTVSEQAQQYSSLQEMGYKTDLRWLELTTNEGIGLRFESDSLFCFSALHYTEEDLTSKYRGEKHLCDLYENDFTELHIDLSQMGVAGDNSWGAQPHSQYIIRPQEYEYTYRIIPINNK